MFCVPNDSSKLKTTSEVSHFEDKKMSKTLEANILNSKNEILKVSKKVREIAKIALSGA